MFESRLEQPAAGTACTAVAPVARKPGAHRRRGMPQQTIREFGNDRARQRPVKAGRHAAGPARYSRRYQRLAIYIVISKPKRISVKAGVVHFIGCLLSNRVECNEQGAICVPDIS
jgi:hypothetical protein